MSEVVSRYQILTTPYRGTGQSPYRGLVTDHPCLGFARDPLDAVRTTCRCRMCRMREDADRPRAVAPEPMPSWERVQCPHCGERVPVDELAAHLEQCEARGGVQW